MKINDFIVPTRFLLFFIFPLWCVLVKKILEFLKKKCACCVVDLIFFASRPDKNKEGLNQMTNTKSQDCHIMESIDFMWAAPYWFVLSMPSTESTGNIRKWHFCLSCEKLWLKQHMGTLKCYSPLGYLSKWKVYFQNVI